MKYSFIFFQIMMLLCVMACSDSDSSSEQVTGTITGKAFFKGSASHGGIVVTIEKTDGLRASSVIISSGRSTLARSITGSTVTSEDGSYYFDGITQGIYTIYAISRNTVEKSR